MDEVRVSALAKEFGMSSKEMLAVLDDLKIPARSASSPLDGAFVRIVREKLPILYPEKVAIQAEAKRRREEERQEDLQRREQARQHEERLLEERCAREREWQKARELVRAAEHAVRDVNRNGAGKNHLKVDTPRCLRKSRRKRQLRNANRLMSPKRVDGMICATSSMSV